jgi:hypothetical protein
MGDGSNARTGGTGISGSYIIQRVTTRRRHPGTCLRCCFGLIWDRKGVPFRDNDGLGRWHAERSTLSFCG